MNLKCDHCEATAKGSRDELQDKGWSRAIFFAPVRKTFTGCPEHQNEIAAKVKEILFRKKKVKPG